MNRKFKRGQRQTVKISQKALVNTSFLSDRQPFPLVIQPALDQFQPVNWAQENCPFVQTNLLKYGAILFRNFGIESAAMFEQFARTLSPDLLDYVERAAPRHAVTPKVYTSTEFSADQYIPLHHEMSYSHNWPKILYFFCDRPPSSGGCTPIVSDRTVLEQINPEIRKKFIHKRVMYVRNYGEGLDMPWQDAFQTDDPNVVEQYCHDIGMEFEWKTHNHLRTKTIGGAIATHPETQDTVWFNHAHMFHVSNLPVTIRNTLLAEFEPDELPRNAFYGDGEPIESEALDHIRAVYNQAAVTFPWQQGDILMLDNFLSSHGREPFEGDRRILVAMANLCKRQEMQLIKLKDI
ncbi:MAG: TauD/TfdA family dioxygenase [Cyanothece sp. SIO2G6]|nr:TauD/TfdA family dioxygenase [Cyanothece sp. SIO2G6]